MLLAFGIACGMLEANKSGKGQVVDAAMVDGSATLMAMFFTMHAAGVFKEERASNMLDGGAHFYGTYETGDGKYISLGSIEPQFYALLIEKAGLDREEFAPQMNQSEWPKLQARLTEVFKTKSRDEWCAIMEGSDVCFAPVLSISEVASHPHNAERRTFQSLDGVMQPSPSPRFSRTAPALSTASRQPGQDTRDVLAIAGYDAGEVDRLIGSQVASEAAQ